MKFRPLPRYMDEPLCMYERFASKVVVRDSGCWEWSAFTVEGYGRFWVNGRNMPAHRASWELHVGPIPDGLLVCHTCDNPSCVRPDHLFLGTCQDNMTDKVNKGRHGCGKHDAHGMAKLTLEKARAIREALSDGALQRELAASFGVNRTTIGKIKRNELWCEQ